MGFGGACISPKARPPKAPSGLRIVEVEDVGALVRALFH
jgi:hypothetical protein